MTTMETPERPPSPTSQPVSAGLARDLIRRRVPHILAIYAGASWGLVEFTTFAVDEFKFSPHWTRIVLVTLIMVLPSVCMLAWFHGKPGRERDQLARTEKVGIPANLVLCVVMLATLFGGEELGSVTASVTVETEDGETIERQVPNAAFTKSMALFPLDLGPGIAEDEAWMTLALPEALGLDLLADEFFMPIPFYGSEASLKERGFENLYAAPLPLKRELARESFAGFMATGEIDRVDGFFRVTLRVYGVDDGSFASETTHEGTDLLALADEMSGSVRKALEIPFRDGVEDLPVRERLSENAAAVEAFFKGVFRYRVHQDTEGATQYLTTATTLDPSFAVAQYTLHLVLRGYTEGEVAAAPLVAAMDHLYRVPERYGFQIKAEYYAETGETDKVAAVARMWAGLHPNDLIALRLLAGMQVANGDWEDVLATMSAIRRLDPLDGRPILSMARAHESLGNHVQSRSLWEEYVERFPGDLSGYYVLADYHRRHGRLDDAREVLERATAVEPLANEPRLRLADLHLDAGRLEEAHAGYERSLRQARTPVQQARALSRLTHYHHRRGEMAAAIQLIESRIEESGLETPLDMAIVDIFVYIDGGRIDDAVTLLERLRAGLPPSLSTATASAAVHVVLASEGVDAALEAQAHAWAMVDAEGLEKGLRAALLGDLGLILDRAGDHEGAAERFMAAVALSPEERFHRGAGKALRRAGLLDEAAAELRSALRLVPADPYAHFEMGLLMEARGDTKSAVGHLTNALAVWENADEDFEPARRARAKLRELGS